MICSIHQPNFFPYYPFFQKIQQSDLFIILTHCQFEKNNYQNRFNIDNKWYTMRVSKHIELIKDKKYLNPIEDWAAIKRKLPKYIEVLNLFDECISEQLSDTNIAIIKKICNLLNITTKIEMDYETNLKSTERLVDLCKHYDADTYFSGISGANYLDLDKFYDIDVPVVFPNLEMTIKKPVLEILYEQIV